VFTQVFQTKIVRQSKFFVKIYSNQNGFRILFSASLAVGVNACQRGLSGA